MIFNKEDKKAAHERAIFQAFCEAAQLPIVSGSVRSRRIPRPDIACLLGDKPYCAELVEITDGDIAKMLDVTSKTGKSVATSYSSDIPLINSFKSKSLIDYQSDGTPLMLLAYYEKQYPVTFDPEFIPKHIGDIVYAMLKSGRWHSIWVYDHWKRIILWQKLRVAA